MFLKFNKLVAHRLGADGAFVPTALESKRGAADDTLMRFMIAKLNTAAHEELLCVTSARQEQ